MKTTILICSIALLAACKSDTSKSDSTTTTSTSAADTISLAGAGAAASQLGTVEAMKGGMDKMMADLNALSMTGNADHDFAAIMRTHHQGAVLMMQAYLRDASDPTLRSKVETGLKNQQQEIEELTAFLGSNQPAAKNSSYGKDAKKMVSDMMMMIDTTSADPNKAFAAMMVTHHESAVHISQMYVTEAKDAKMKEMAKKIAAEQQQETNELKKWMEAHP